MSTVSPWLISGLLMGFLVVVTLWSFRLNIAAWRRGVTVHEYLRLRPVELDESERQVAISIRQEKVRGSTFWAVWYVLTVATGVIEAVIEITAWSNDGALSHAAGACVGLLIAIYFWGPSRRELFRVRRRRTIRVVQ